MKAQNIVKAQPKNTVGHYIGDASVNRAIPHGLGRVPSLVSIYNSSGIQNFIIQGDPGTQIVDIQASAIQNVTIMDAVYFYVGNAANYAQSANFNGDGYKWAAM
jgi:hypothetical protein